MENTLYGSLKKTADRFPDNIALIEGNETLSFSQLLDQVDRRAACFPDHIKSVGIVMDHGIEMIVSIFAVLKCGARYIPAEPSFPIKRIQFMMKEADVDFILTEQAYAQELSDFPILFAGTLSCGGPDTIDHAKPDSPAYVLYTSGTTGRPKGVCVTNANVCHYVRAFEHEFHIGPGDVMLQYSVCSFDIFVEEVFASLLNGAALAIPSDEEKKDIASLMRFVEKNHVTIISGFPYLLAKMNALRAIPSSLRLLISGGDVLRGIYIDHLLDQVEVYNTYGPSETTVCAAYYRCTHDVLEDGTYPIGHPVLGTQIKLLDENGNEVPKGEVGEICIFGDGVSLGYIGNHDKENEAFVTLEDGKRMYRSGDLGYRLPDGNLGFLHRKDTQIMIYGKRVEVSEVESMLCRCPGIAEAIVRAFEDEHHLAYMIAYIVPNVKDLRLSDIKKELSQNLTPFMIPEFFVKMDHIPLNANGKPDVSRLPVVMKDGD